MGTLHNKRKAYALVTRAGALAPKMANLLQPATCFWWGKRLSGGERWWQGHVTCRMLEAWHAPPHTH